MTDAGECPLCGGCGEIEATAQNMERDTYGCPICISTELRAEIGRVTAEKDKVAAYANHLEFTLTRAMNLIEALLNELLHRPGGPPPIEILVAKSALDSAMAELCAKPDSE